MRRYVVPLWAIVLLGCYPEPTADDVLAACQERHEETGRDVELCVLSKREDLRWDKIPGRPGEPPEFEVSCEHPDICHKAFRPICHHQDYTIVDNAKEDLTATTIGSRVGNVVVASSFQASKFNYLLRCAAPP